MTGDDIDQARYVGRERIGGTRRHRLRCEVRARSWAGWRALTLEVDAEHPSTYVVELGPEGSDGAPVA
jgi:hypothetical protein